MDRNNLGFYEALNPMSFEVKEILGTPCILRKSKYGTNVHVDFLDMTKEFNGIAPYQLFSMLGLDESIVSTVNDGDQIIVIGHE